MAFMAHLRIAAGEHRSHCRIYLWVSCGSCGGSEGAARPIRRSTRLGAAEAAVALPLAPLRSAPRGEGRAAPDPGTRLFGFCRLPQQRYGISGEAADRAQRHMADDAHDAEIFVVDERGGELLVGR